jgi:hypothetical protein
MKVYTVTPCILGVLTACKKVCATCGKGFKVGNTVVQVRGGGDRYKDRHIRCARRIGML